MKNLQEIATNISNINHIHIRSMSNIFTSMAFSSMVAMISASDVSIALSGETKTVRNQGYAIDVNRTENAGDSVVYFGDWGGNQSGSVRNLGNIQAYKVTDQAHQIRKSETPIGAESQDLVARNGILYAANDEMGFSIYDMTDSSAPILLSKRIDGTICNSVSIADGQNGRRIAFATYSFAGGDGKIAIYNVTNASSVPNPLIYIPNPGTEDVFDTQVFGDRLYVLAGDGRQQDFLEVLDIKKTLSSGAAPTLLGKFAMPSSTFGFSGRLKSDGHYAYLVSSFGPGNGGELQVIDVSNPSAMAVSGRLSIPDIDYIPFKGPGLELANGLVYIVGKTALHAFSVVDPSHPAQVASASLPSDFSDCLGGNVVAWNGNIYVAAFSFSGGGGLAIYRLQGNRPPVVHAVDQTFLTDPGLPTAAVTPSRLFLSSWSDPDGDPVTAKLFPAGPYRVGANAVQLIVSDGVFSSSANLIITVLDKEPPRVSFGALNTLLLGNTHQLVDIGMLLDIRDNVMTSIYDITIQQNEPVFSGPGDPSPDAVVRTDVAGHILGVSCRSEFLPSGHGRVYLLTIRAFDTSGNMTISRPVVVLVPKSSSLVDLSDVLTQAFSAVLSGSLPYNSLIPFTSG